MLASLRVMTHQSRGQHLDRHAASQRAASWHEQVLHVP